jgi:hypothetical protein
MKLNKNICHAKESVWVRSHREDKGFTTAKENDAGSEKSQSKWKVKKREIPSSGSFTCWQKTFIFLVIE